MQRCPADDVVSCQCPKNMESIINGANASYYPRAGCFRFGRQMVTARQYDRMLGQHMMERIVHAPQNSCTRSIFIDHDEHAMFLSIRVQSRALERDLMIGLHLPVYPRQSEGTASFAVHIWRIQRAIRAYLHRKNEARALAVSMGWHERLGRNSFFAGIPEDVMRVMLGYTYSFSGCDANVNGPRLLKRNLIFQHTF